MTEAWRIFQDEQRRADVDLHRPNSDMVRIPTEPLDGLEWVMSRKTNKNAGILVSAEGIEPSTY